MTVNGSATFVIPEGLVTNLGMSASVSVTGGDTDSVG